MNILSIRQISMNHVSMNWTFYEMNEPHYGWTWWGNTNTALHSQLMKNDSLMKILKNH